jgi:hypothetical protein
MFEAQASLLSSAEVSKLYFPSISLPPQVIDAIAEFDYEHSSGFSNLTACWLQQRYQRQTANGSDHRASKYPADPPPPQDKASGTLASSASWQNFSSVILDEE